jgi:glucan phosphoethanolaminetransferase (alkaline phosphatase superfamily)
LDPQSKIAITPLWLRRFLIVTAAAQCIALACFIYAVRRSDAAMDKSGIGDVAAMQRWSAVAGVSGYSFLFLWLLGLTMAIAAWLLGPRLPSAIRPARIAALALLLPPVMFALGWLAALP